MHDTTSEIQVRAQAVAEELAAVVEGRKGKEMSLAPKTQGNN